MLRTKVTGPKFDDIFTGAETDVARFLTEAMIDTTGEVKEAFRDQVRAAGFKDPTRLANAIRGNAYPDRAGRVSLEPRGVIAARDSKRTGRGIASILDSYVNGRLIVPRAGKRWLLIPSADCPKNRNGDAWTYDQVEARFGKLEWIPNKQSFATPSARGRGSFVIVTKRAVIRKASSRWRKATANELAGKTRNPRPVQTVIMFTAVRSVKKPKALNLPPVATFAEARFDANLTARWR